MDKGHGSTLGAVAIISGSVLGAGFVSGKETVVFFGYPNLFTPLVFAAIFAVCMVLYGNFASEHATYAIEDINYLCFGKIGKVVNVLLLSAYMISLSTMLAGAEECMEINFPHKVPVFAFLTAVAATVILHFGLRGIKCISFAAVPLIIIFVLAALLCKNETVQPEQSTRAGVTMPIIYALFNTVMSAAVLVKASRYYSKKVRLISAVASSTLLALLTVLIQIIVYKNGTQSNALPLLAVFEGGILGVLGKTAMLVAIVVGLCTTGCPLVDVAKSAIGDKTIACASVFFVALLFSFLGFDFIISYVYPAVALLGCMMTTGIIVYIIKDKLSKRNFRLSTHRTDMKRKNH